MNLSYIDIHSHLNDKRFDKDLPEVLSRMEEVGVASVVVGTDKKMSEDAVALAEKHDSLWAAVGQHPVDMPEEEFDPEFYRKLAQNERVVAIGECGFDYYWPEHGGWKNGEQEEKKRQRELFEQHIVLAEEAGKPLMIHGRPSEKSVDAYVDILEVLKRHREVGGNVHFFAGTVEIARQFLDLGLTMSFTGVLTFTHDYDEVVKFIPLDRMHAETDAPYVAPAPHRGKRNEPAYVVEIVRAIARIRGQSEDVVMRELMQNARRVFGVELA